MSESACQKVLHIPELLELILVQTDMRTLLTSVQRVCRRWHELVQNSHEIQIVLFFEPCNKSQGQERTANPLIDSLWHGFFRREMQYSSLGEEGSTRPSPLLSIRANRAYHRKTASWRRMLIQQPPTSRMGTIEIDDPYCRPIYSITNKNAPRDVLRLDDLYTGIEEGVLIPGQDPLFFWFEPLLIREPESKFPRVHDISMPKLLADCDVVIFCGECRLPFSVSLSDHQPHVRFDLWMGHFGFRGSDQMSPRVPLRGYLRF